MSSQRYSMKEHENEDERGRIRDPYHHNQPPTKGRQQKKGPLSKKNKVLSSLIKGMFRENKESKIRVFRVFGSDLKKSIERFVTLLIPPLCTLQLTKLTHPILTTQGSLT